MYCGAIKHCASDISDETLSEIAMMRARAEKSLVESTYLPGNRGGNQELRRQRQENRRRAQANSEPQEGGGGEEQAPERHWFECDATGGEALHCGSGGAALRQRRRRQQRWWGAASTATSARRLRGSKNPRADTSPLSVCESADGDGQIVGRSGCGEQCAPQRVAQLCHFRSLCPRRCSTDAYVLKSVKDYRPCPGHGSICPEAAKCFGVMRLYVPAACVG